MGPHINFVIYLYNIINNIKLQCICLSFHVHEKINKLDRKIEISIAMLTLIGLIYTSITCENEFRYNCKDTKNILIALNNYKIILYKCLKRRCLHQVMI